MINASKGYECLSTLAAVPGIMLTFIPVYFRPDPSASFFITQFRPPFDVNVAALPQRQLSLITCRARNIFGTWHKKQLDKINFPIYSKLRFKFWVQRSFGLEFLLVVLNGESEKNLQNMSNVFSPRKWKIIFERLFFNLFPNSISARKRRQNYYIPYEETIKK